MNTKDILERIAKDNNTTPEEVKKEMRSAIREGMKSNDTKTQMLWKQISPDGKEPSIESVLQFCVDRLSERR